MTDAALRRTVDVAGRAGSSQQQTAGVAIPEWLERRNDEEVSLIPSSPLLDDACLFQALGLRRDEFAQHQETYLAIPLRERPALSPFFDVKWYLQGNPDVERVGMDAFAHFLRYGLAEGRAPHPLVALEHIWGQGRAPPAREHPSPEQLAERLDSNAVDPSPYFDIAFYLANCDAARTVGGSALRHFLQAPVADIVIPNRYFDVSFYTERYPDVPRCPRRAFLHFVKQGDPQRRFPSELFDPDWYVHVNPDISARAEPPLRHFLQHGRAEGRAPRGRQTAVARPASRPADIGGTLGFVPDIAEGRQRYLAVQDAVVSRRRRTIEAVPEFDARPVVVRDIDVELSRLRFRSGKRPKLSILIPCYNELKLTIECLVSIARSKTRCTYEVVVADDCSPDEETRRLAEIPGLIYRRQSRNLGFLLNCNEVFKSLTGKYVLLLNNDAQVRPGAIDKLLRVLDDDPRLGAVGPKILFPNGRLQEAGCTIGPDAACTMTGLMENPKDPAYSFHRDVQHVSGAALMFRRSLGREALFDPRFAPAYCEDVDLCLHILSKGYRIKFVASAEVVHHLSVSHADQNKKIRTIRVNENKLAEKWAELLAEINKIRVISFYLPQFHPIKENDHWWGAGFTEWKNVTCARPSYAGHYQPHIPADLGFYDLRIGEIYRKQAELMHRYSLGGACIYYYNFAGAPLLNTPLQTILSDRSIPLPFCLCWANENWSRRWDGGTREVLLEQSYDKDTIRALMDDVVRSARDPRYIRVGGKPLLLIYRPLMMPDPRKTVRELRERAREIGGLHLVFVESLESIDSGVQPEELGFDASVEFPPQGIAVPMTDAPKIYKEGWRGFRHNYEATVVNAVHRPGASWPRYPAIFPSWDNTPRQPLEGTSFDRCSPEAFQVYAEEQIAKCKAMHVGDSRLLFVNAWNEWAEGAHLEPDIAYGHRWLEALRTALLRQGCI